MPREHRVLVVDDDQAMRAMLLDLLAQFGHESAAACGVDEALQQLETGNFSLIVSDIQMDPHSGFDLLETLGARRDATPVILMSAFAAPDVERRALKQGARAFLRKPFDPDALLEIVDRVACDERGAVPGSRLSGRE